MYLLIRKLGHLYIACLMDDQGMELLQLEGEFVSLTQAVNYTQAHPLPLAVEIDIQVR